MTIFKAYIYNYQCRAIYQSQNLKFDKRFSQLKNKSPVHIIQRSIDDHYNFDRLGKSAVPSSDKRLGNSISNSWKDKEKSIVILCGSLVKLLRGYEILKRVDGCKVFVNSFGGAEVLCIKDHT